MNKWTWLALGAFVVVLGGSWWLLSQPKDKPQTAAPLDGEMGVEEFDAEDAPDEKDNSYDMMDDNDAPAPKNAAPGNVATGPKPQGKADVETIDEEDDLGETVEDPVVIEDNDEETLPPTQGAQPAPKEGTP